MKTSSELLAELSNASGTPGSEGEVRRIIRQELKGLAKVSYDRTGSIICRKHGEVHTPKIMVAGHLDEVGFIVRLITNDGFVKFHNLGGWWGHTLLAQRVVIKTAKGDVPGVIGAKPVHYLQAEERKRVIEIKDMYIDVGAFSQEEAMESFGILPGDHIVPDTKFRPLTNPRLVSGKAFDDRAGVALMIDAIRQIAREEPPNAIYGVGTVQEEVGTRGAQTAAAEVQPDVAIVLEGSPADDIPGFPQEERQGILGKGPQIRLFDPSMIPNRALSQFVVRTACECGISHQVAVRTSGGTDGRTIHLHNSGVPTVVIAPPVRYIHGHVSMLHLDDYEQTLFLLLELLRRLDAKTVASFTDYSVE